MPYAVHLRINFGGSLGTANPPPEEWSCTLNAVRGGGNLSPTECGDIATVVAAFITGGQVSSQAKLRYVKSASIDTTGHVDGDVTRWDGLASAATTSYQHPFQCAMVASLRTGERGPSKRGRIYLPAPALQVSAVDGLVSDADRDSYQAAVATMLTGIKTVLGTAGNLVVASSKGYNTIVTGVNVGRTIDTQRRRRRSLDEAYDPVTPI